MNRRPKNRTATRNPELTARRDALRAAVAARRETERATEEVTAVQKAADYTDIVLRFAEYRTMHDGWGPLASVMGDLHLSDADVKGARRAAISTGDTEAAALVTVLMAYNEVERSQLADDLENVVVTA